MTNHPTRQHRTMRRAATTLIALLAIAALAVACLAYRPWEHIGGARTAGTGSGTNTVDVSQLRTADVTRGTLNASTTLNASLAYDTARGFAAAGGTVTQLPTAGTVIGLGEQVYEQNGVGVPLFSGERPFWRTLQDGVSDGPDVAQLERNLADLGFYTGEVGPHFDWLTREAIRQWQRSLGLTGDAVTGVFDPSSVALAVTAPVRITTVDTTLGSSGESPASYTGVALHAEATLSATQAATFKAGDPVSVTLPDNTTLETTLSAVDQGGQPTGEEGKTTSPSVRVDFPDQSKVERFGTASVRLTVPNRSADATETLIVPVTALVASASGAYALDVVRGDALERVNVRIGLVADAQVQILEADGLQAGDKVVVS